MFTCRHQNLMKEVWNSNMLISQWPAKQRTNTVWVMHTAACLWSASFVLEGQFVLVPTHTAGKKTFPVMPVIQKWNNSILYYLYTVHFVSQRSPSICWISEAFICTFSIKVVALLSTLDDYIFKESSTNIHFKAADSLISILYICSDCHSVVFNGRAKSNLQNLWMSVIKVNVLRAAQRCML